MTYQEKLKKLKYTKNIKYVLKHAQTSDFINGHNWYKNARLFSFDISQKYNFSFRKTCAILSALSPRNKWERNKLDTELLISYLLGFNNKMPKCSTYGNMVKKAITIFNSPDDRPETMLRLLNGPKIKSFFLNIYDVNSQCITVDSWIQLISLGKYLSINQRPSLKIKDYRLIELIIK